MYKIPAKTVFLGKKIISLAVCESTNSVMQVMAQNDELGEGSVIITESQTNGRGQGGNRWDAQEGANLTFSVLFKPLFLDPSRQFHLNMAVSLAVADALQGLGFEAVRVKWPNDVMLSSKKVCGILIENQLQGQKFVQSIVGIGLNVNQKEFEWPSASSLSLMGNRYFNRSEVLEIVLEKLENRYKQVQSKNFEGIKRDYYSCLYWLGEQHQFDSEGKAFEGKIIGVDEVGRLMIETSGATKKFNFKEVSFVA